MFQDVNKTMTADLGSVALPTNGVCPLTRLKSKVKKLGIPKTSFPALSLEGFNQLNMGDVLKTIFTHGTKVFDALLFIKDKCGPYVQFRFGRRNVLMIFDIPTGRALLSKTDGTYGTGIEKDQFSQAGLSQTIGAANSLLTEDRNTWEKVREVTGRFLSGKYLEDPARLNLIKSTIDKNLDRLVSEVRESNGGLKIDLQRLVAKTSLDVVLNVLFGYQLDEPAHEKTLDAVSNVLKAMMPETLNPFPVALYRLFKYTPWGSKLKESQKVLDLLAFDVINKGLSSVPNPLIAELNTAYQNDQLKLKDEILTLILAGHETTTSLISWSFYHLLKTEGNNNYLKLLRDQSEAVISANSFQKADNESPYSLVFAESSRISSPLYMIFRRTSRNILLDHTDSKVTAEFAQNDHAEEVFYRQLKQTGLKLACDERMNIIPAGTLLCFPLGAGNLDQATFGDDANIFNPDRYKNKSLLNKFFLFNWGKRACSGAPLARIEYPLIIGGILKRFNLELANRSEPDITCSITRMFSDGLEVVIKER